MTSTKKSTREAEPSSKHSDVRAVVEPATIRPPFDLQRFAREQARQTQPPPASVERAKVTPTPSREATRSELCERFFVGDYATVLKLAEALLAQNEFDEVALDYVDECRRILEKEYAERVGSMRVVPVLLAPLERIRSVAIDHQAGFFLAQVDGSTTLEVLLDILPMPRWEALRLVDRLVREGVLMLGK